MIKLSRHPDGAVSFEVKVAPRASKSEIVGIEGDALKVRLKAPPVEGKANEALVKFLADALGVSRSAVEIVSGHTSRKKVVRIKGTTPEKIQELIPGR